MNQNEIIEMARQAGFEDFDRWCEHYPQETQRWCQRMEAFAKLVAAKEREACADICDRFQARDVGMQPAECAGAIRARGKT
jgi:hypothetical protein